MKTILCDDKTCIHNEDIKVEGIPISVCSICENIKIHSYNDTCSKYEEIGQYLNRIK